MIVATQTRAPAATAEYPKSLEAAMFSAYGPEWLLKNAERATLIQVLQTLRPEVSIQIGAGRGGSLSVVSKYSQKVYCLDDDPECRKLLDHQSPKTEFVIGYSQKTLPLLVQKLEREDANVGFVLIDGDHNMEGLRQDIDNILALKPTCPLCVIIHDSFNPDCRWAIRETDWAANPYVHYVEIDFVPGVYVMMPDRSKQMWGGLAAVWILPIERDGELESYATYDLVFDAVGPVSCHDGPKVLTKPNTSFQYSGSARRPWKMDLIPSEEEFERS